MSPVLERPPVIDEVRATVVRRVASPERRKKLIRLLSILIDKGNTPGEEGAP